jgi:hypothetical protein
LQVVDSYHLRLPLGLIFPFRVVICHNTLNWKQYLYNMWRFHSTFRKKISCNTSCSVNLVIIWRFLLIVQAEIVQLEIINNSRLF